jgi:hypothetical protein
MMRVLLLCVCLPSCVMEQGTVAEGEGESSEGEGESSEGEGEEGEGDEGEAEEGEGEGEPIDVIVGVGYGGIRILSIDHGQTWCESAIDDPNGGDDPNLLREVATGQGQFISGGWNHLYVSNNGWRWDDVLAGAPIVSGNWMGGVRLGVLDGVESWLSCGGYGTAMRSVDGRTWQSVDYPGESAGRSLAYGNGTFVCANDDGWRSTSDTVNWQSIAGDGQVEFIDGAFQTRSDISEGFGVRVRVAWPAIEVAAAGSDVFVFVFEPRRAIERFAFLQVRSSDFDVEAMPAPLRTCLGI